MFPCEVYNSTDHVISNFDWVFPGVAWKKIFFLSDKKKLQLVLVEWWQMQFLVLRKKKAAPNSQKPIWHSQLRIGISGWTQTTSQNIIECNHSVAVMS